MTTLITGGSKCGKSHLAESLLDGFEGEKIYAATMQPYGDEAFAAIERHRRLRSAKGFVTAEKYTDIHELELLDNSAVLLECMGNLLANEMFSADDICDPSEKILRGIHDLSKRAARLVIVTNQVGSDGIDYTEGTAAYIACLGKINSGIAAIADNVIECVYGIPIVLKGTLL